jgi:hypothetical protein
MITDKIDAEHDQGQGDAGKERDPVFARHHELESVRDEHAEGRFRHRHADAEEGKRRLRRDGMREVDRRDDDQRRHRVRQHVAKDDPARPEGEAARRKHVFAVALNDRRASRRPREISPLDDDQSDDHLVDTLPQHRQQNERHEDRWKGKLDVHHPHQNRIYCAAEVGRDEADGGPDEQTPLRRR